jgi:hypothetical protein
MDSCRCPVRPLSVDPPPMRPAHWAAAAFSRRCRQQSHGSTVLLSAPSPASSAVPSGSVDAALGSVAFLRSAAAVLWVLRSAPVPASVPSVSAGVALGSVAGVLHRGFQVLFFNQPLPAYFTSLRLCACTILPQHVVPCLRPLRTSATAAPSPSMRRRPPRRPW